MILSEDLRNLKGTTEEIFYSLALEPSDSEHPYLVYCMLRDKSPNAQPGPLDVPVYWEVSADWRGSLELLGKGKQQIGLPGQVSYVSENFGYSGLVRLTGFQRPPTPNEKPSLLGDQAMPPMPRKWGPTDAASNPIPAENVRD